MGDVHHGIKRCPDSGPATARPRIYQKPPVSSSTMRSKRGAKQVRKKRAPPKVSSDHMKVVLLKPTEAVESSGVLSPHTCGNLAPYS